MKKILSIFVSDGEETSIYKKVFNMAFLFLIFYLFYRFTLDGYTMKWETLIPYIGKIFDGYKMTLIITFFAMIVSVILGSLLTFFNSSKLLILQYLSKSYVEIIRGTPFLVQIIFFFYIITPAFGIENRYFIGILILAIFSSAYVSEIIRAGIESIEESQHETARAVGFTTFQKYRYVIFPQVFKRILPSLTGQLSSLVKDSSLLSVIAVSEFTLKIQEITAINFRTYENYIILAVGYLLITFPISIISRKLERKFSYETQNK
ncbi:amino acid ABC transporter permease [Jeotgalibaca sp. MA1X17-3]|uniref:amino acid ABC transporter permease n=1 Tax=Jeotgalibaca sp. MA1X17-3 TaxID=2908211 RepID=UPI001F29713D|nr:amino acid ABC transporter permease [Jeotgalibaca sp. MA1X17-3]UJF14749.1 amino acid ABC transporter permease [Jeotgalibaca sp. MA1X17-3]